jgi:hypothetical protein
LRKLNRKPIPAAEVTGRLVTGAGTTLADLLAGVAVLDVSAPTGSTSYWCGVIAEADGHVVGFTLTKFNSGQRYQVTFDGETWECDCPDCTFRERTCKHVLALHSALTKLLS